MMDLAIVLAVLALLLVAKGFFSGSEIALVNADKVKLQHKAKQGSKGARYVLDAFRRPDELLSITLIGTNLTTIALTSIGTVLMIRLFGASGDIYAFLILTPILLIMGEIVPKSVMQQFSDTVTPYIIYPLRWLGRIFYPIIFVFSRVARFAARLAGGGTGEKGLFMTREQLSAVVETAERSNKLAAFDKGQIRQVMRFAQRTAAESMIPMAEVTAFNRSKSLPEAVDLAVRYGYNRLPVYEEIASNVVGVLFLDNWTLMDPALGKKALDDFIHPARFISPLQTVDELIPELAERQDRMAVVVDEYGSAIGIITLEDIIGEVVGNIDAGFDYEGDRRRHARVFEKQGSDGYVFDARFPVSEVNEILGIDLPTAEYHTIGGLVLARLRHIPKEDESIVESGFRFTVIEATERAIGTLKVEAV